MPYLNHVTLVGHLSKDPDIRFSTSGTAIANVSLYTKEGVKKNGQWEKETTFHDCICFGKQAEWLQEARKGQLVIATGRIQKRKWQTKDGQDRWSVEIVCDSIQVVKDKEQTGGTSGGYSPPSDDLPFDDGSDIPFSRSISIYDARI